MKTTTTTTSTATTTSARATALAANAKLERSKSKPSKLNPAPAAAPLHTQEALAPAIDDAVAKAFPALVEAPAPVAAPEAAQAYASTPAPEAAPAAQAEASAAAPEGDSAEGEAEERMSKKEQLLRRLDKLALFTFSVEDRFGVGAMPGLSCAEYITNALASLNEARKLVREYPEDWTWSTARPAAAKPDRSIVVGDRVRVRQSDSIRAIYGDAILVAELDNMEVISVGSKLLRCVTPETKAVVFMPIKHVEKLAGQAAPAAPVTA